MQVTLLGESNSIKYNVEPQFFDCGIQPYDKHTERDLYINNQGHVPFDFSVDLSKLSRPGIIEASPLSGKVAAGDKAHVKLKVRLWLYWCWEAGGLWCCQAGRANVAVHSRRACAVGSMFV